MLTEALTWLLTPAPAVARRLGHLAETIAISARYRRCRAAWTPHLIASRQALLASARRAASHRRALVLGSGPLLDVPLAELAAQFESVWLVDIVHPWSSRLAARRYRNVRLIEQDLTNSLARLPGAPTAPTLFLYEPEVDWVASVNLVSQLGNQPVQWLARHRPDLNANALADYSQTLIRQHLAWLVRFDAPVCILADLRQCRLDRDGRPVEIRDFAAFLEGWQIDAQWRWDLAPAGELSDHQTAFHDVVALSRQ
jgi:hypothetical protein